MTLSDLTTLRQPPKEIERKETKDEFQKKQWSDKDAHKENEAKSKGIRPCAL